MSDMKTVCKNQGWSGIGREVWETGTGVDTTSWRKPKAAPRKTSGTEIPNQRTTRATMVLKGTACDDPTCQSSKSMPKKTMKTSPGYPNAVISVHCFHSERP